MNTLNCPACGGKLQTAGNTNFCKCGWSKSFNKTREKEMNWSIARNMLFASFFVVGFMVYFGYWGSASLQIIPLKVQQWTGSLSPSSFAKLKTVCMELKKYNCVESAHTSFFQSSKELEVLEQLGEFQYRRNRFSAASQTYNLYFTQKGSSIKAAYNYARLLEKENQIDMALSYYEYALKARPNTLQITVMRAYIDLLIKVGKPEKAKQALIQLRPFLKASNPIVQQEYNKWSKKVF